MGTIMTNRKRPSAVFVSSYGESCGNAHFTGVLISSVGTVLDTSCLKLDLALLQARNRLSRKLAEQHVKALVSQLAHADYVNIQVEPALFGARPRDICRRLEALMTANTHTSITLHNARLLSDRWHQSWRGVIKQFLKGRLRGALNDTLFLIAMGRNLSINRTIVSIATQNNISIIVHTKRAERQIKQIYNYENVVVHPLKFPSGGSECVERGERILREIKLRFGIDAESNTIGIFGYISRYKGHHDAIQALSVLDKRFTLLIVGRQHPQTIQAHGPGDEYIKSLVELAVDLKVHDRVIFLWEYGQEDFEGLMSAVDVCWLPYYEVGQDGSGIAAQCLQHGKSVVCSASFAFDEALDLDPHENVYRCDIGNYLGLASMTRFAAYEESGRKRDGRKIQRGRLSADTQVEAYLKAWGLWGNKGDRTAALYTDKSNDD